MSPLYPLIMLAAVGSAAIISRFTQRDLPLVRSQRIFVGLGGFCGAMLGAKLPFLLSDVDGLLSGTAWFSSGKTILCGLVGGYFGVELAKKHLNIRTKTGDSFAVPVAVGVGIGRLACFAGGCCFGTPTDLPWGCVFPATDALRRHPTQIYEAIFHLTAAGILFVMWRRQLLKGQLIKLYIIAYLAYRYATEFIRPEARMWAGLTGYQWAALALIPLFAGLWMRDARQVVSETAGSRQG
ncbi:MAG: prolipoprotein diacylglyceryl transferase [Planctomycetaceae bacterium]